MQCSTLPVLLLALVAAGPLAAEEAHKPRPHQAPSHQPTSHHTADRHAPAHRMPKRPVPVVQAPPAPHPTTLPPAAAPVIAPAPAAPAEPTKGSNTGLPLPRFASLKTDEVNLRTGPGLRYPIDWVYKRRDLPVEIQREFEVWRLIADQEGVKGWVHQATLVGRRTLVVSGTEQTMRAEAQDAAAAIARLKPGVIGRVRSCEANAAWCQVQVGDYRGWLRRDAFWGSAPGEAIQ